MRLTIGNYTAVFLLYLMGFLPFALLLCLIFVHGPLIALLSFIALVLSILLQADKLLLNWLRAIPLNPGSPLHPLCQNLSFRIGTGQVRLFQTSVFPFNFYFLDSIFGAPSLIIGNTILERFSATEIKTLVFFSLMQVRDQKAWYRTLITAGLIIFNWPLFLSRLLPNSSFLKSETFHFLSNLCFPFLALKYHLLPAQWSQDLIEGHRKEASGFIDHQKQMDAVLSTIENLEAIHPSNAMKFILEGVAITPNAHPNAVFLLMKSSKG